MRIRHLKPAVAEADMTPMIDMTFQLIAFFMIVSNFEQMQADERVMLPVDELAVPPESPRQDDIVVNVGFHRDPKTGKKLDEDPFIFYGDAKDGIRIPDSAGYFERERQRQIAIAGQDSLSEVTIVIRADKTVPTGLIQEMMRIAQEVGGGHGFTRFSLKAQKGEDEP
jgi:biopolymer transport protein ExbD